MRVVPLRTQLEAVAIGLEVKPAQVVAGGSDEVAVGIELAVAANEARAVGIEPLRFMNTNTNMQPAPEANSGAEITPNIAVVPPPKPRRRPPSELNLAQVRAVQRAKQVCLAAQKPEYAATLQAKGMEATFVTTLLGDIEAATRRCALAVQCTTNKESATRSGQATEQALVRSLRDLQTAARQLHQHAAPEKLQDYLIGERITDSKAVLDQSAQTIISKADEERPPGVDTQIIQQAEAQRQAYLQANQSQETEGSRAQTERAARDTLADSIQQRCQQIQFAAERAWPAGNPAHAGVRREFRLPATRPYTG